MSTLTSILSSDIISASRSTINTNFGNLNSGKVESPIVASVLGTGTADTSTFLRGDLTWQAPTSGAMTLLRASNGSTSSTSATNLDTIAISGLTILDTLYITYFIQAGGGQPGGVYYLYSNTDSLVLADLTNNNALASGNMFSGSAIIRTHPIVPDNYNVTFDGTNSTGIVAEANTQTAIIKYLRSNNGTTNFTGSWTLAFRSNGVTAGDTTYWSWAVYKIAGQ